MMLNLYNKSSQGLAEITTNSVDLVIIDPPFNIGTVYAGNPDRLSPAQYMQLIEDTVTHACRVIRPNAHIIVGAADTIMYNQEVWAQAAYFEHAFADMQLVRRHLAFESCINNRQELDVRWQNFCTNGGAHSNVMHYLVFKNTNAPQPFVNGQTMYENFIPSADHPCPTPPKIIDMLLDPIDVRGQDVLDIFMGTGSFGEYCQSRCAGSYTGYEIDERIFSGTKKRLTKA